MTRHNPDQDFPRAGDVLEVETERLAYGGDAVARHEGLAIFISLAAPGERLRVRITERKKNYARAAIEEILRPSDTRREPRCPHFGQCGGCQLQHISYEAQLRAKAGFISESLDRIARIDWPHEIEIRHGAEYGYRTRARFKLQRVGERTLVGFNRVSSLEVCDIESCPVLTNDLNRALSLLRSRVEGRSAVEEEVEAASGDDSFSFDPRIVKTPVEIERRVGGFVYHFAPSVFFQANSDLLEALVREATDKMEGDFAIDLYAGAGLFTLPLARRFKRVIAVEADSKSSRFAVENLSANQIHNAEVHCSGAERWLESFASRKKRQQPDLILLDPPRTGAAKAVESINKLSPSHIVYVSCDPTTLSRDIARLVDAGYGLKSVLGFDIFPQTFHIEAVVVLKRD